MAPLTHNLDPAGEARTGSPTTPAQMRTKSGRTGGGPPSSRGATANWGRMASQGASLVPKVPATEKTAERAPTIWGASARAPTVGRLDRGPGLRMSSVLMGFRSTGAILLISWPELVRAAAERARMIWGASARILTVSRLDRGPGLGASLVPMAFRSAGATLLISWLEQVREGGRVQT